jgi:hypothetical protein
MILAKKLNMEADQIIYLDDEDRPTTKDLATRIRILGHEDGEPIEVYGVISPPIAPA